MLNDSRRNQSGFTLVELLVALVLSLIVIAAITAATVALLRTNADTIKMTRLHEQLRSVLVMMTNNIRRAGSDSNAMTAGPNPATSIFMPINVADLGTGSDCAEPFSPSSRCDCIVFSYDVNVNGTQETKEFFGFGYNSNDDSVRVRYGDNACTTSNMDDDDKWKPLTDDTIEITNLDITPTLQVSSIPNSNITPLDDGGTLATVTVRKYDITLSGRLKNDPSVTRTFTETVHVRNDLFTPGT